MKLYQSILLLSVITGLSSACVSRTTTIEKGYGEDTEDTKLVWVWQEEFRNKK
jgi:hypothetical protein